jgi:hypothetical protein
MGRRLLGARPLTGAEREARRKARVVAEVRELRMALARIADEISLRSCRRIAREALASVSRDQGGEWCGEVAEGAEQQDGEVCGVA